MRELGHLPSFCDLYRHSLGPGLPSWHLYVLVLFLSRNHGTRSQWTHSAEHSIRMLSHTLLSTKHLIWNLQLGAIANNRFNRINCSPWYCVNSGRAVLHQECDVCLPLPGLCKLSALVDLMWISCRPLCCLLALEWQGAPLPQLSHTPWR